MFFRCWVIFVEDVITDRIVDIELNWIKDFKSFKHSFLHILHGGARTLIIYTKLYSDEIKNETTENIVKLFTVVPV